jgi:hypothetical protein
MKRLSGPRETSDLSKSVHQQLNMYAIVAAVKGTDLQFTDGPKTGVDL